MFYSKVILKTLTLFIFLFTQNDGGSQTRLDVGERINGPANIRDTVNGKLLFSLNDGVIIETSPAINKWVKIGVYVKLTIKQMEDFKLEKNISLINENGKTFFDIVPAIQFIFNSQVRIDLAYRKELYSSMLRTAPNGVYFNLYYTFFNLKKRNDNGK